MCRSFCLISLATNMLEGWDIIHLKGEIHSSVWSAKIFLYDIREPRYKQIKMGYQISKISDIGQSNILNSDVSYCFTYIYRNGVELEACLRILPLKWDKSQPSYDAHLRSVKIPSFSSLNIQSTILEQSYQEIF